MDRLPTTGQGCGFGICSSGKFVRWLLDSSLFWWVANLFEAVDGKNPSVQKQDAAGAFWSRTIAVQNLLVGLPFPGNVTTAFFNINSAVVPKPPQTRQGNVYRLVRPDRPASLIREDINPMVEQLLGPPSTDAHAAELRIVHRSVLESPGPTEYDQEVVELGFLERGKRLRGRRATFRGPDAEVVPIFERTLREDGR